MRGLFPTHLLAGAHRTKKWTGDEAPILIGDNNIFREFCTVHLPSTFATASTTIGDSNLFCSYAHIGHEKHGWESLCLFQQRYTSAGMCTWAITW